MILFSEDWKRYPKAIVHLNTTNRSFVELSLLYRDMGVKNHAFLLALHNPELQDIDPHDPNLSVESILKVAHEAKHNPWYFFREILKVPAVGSVEPVCFRAHRGNIALYWLFFNHVMTILEQVRQTGKSLAARALIVYLMNIGAYRTQINLLTKDDSLRVDSLIRIRELQDNLVYYLNQKQPDDIANTERLTISKYHNEFKAHVPNKSPKAALNIGRGLTSPIFHIDEAAFISNIGIILPAALAAGVAARDMAHNANRPYGTLITTTAGKKDDRDGRYIYDMIQESAIFTEAFFDAKDMTELYEIIRANSSARSNGRRVLRVYATFNHRQLGYTDEWLYRQLEETNAKGDEADRDFFNRWTSGTQVSPLSTQDAERIRQSEHTAPYSEITAPYAYVLRWYLPREQKDAIMQQSHYVIGLDTSDASGGDDIAMVMRDIRSGEVVCAANINETNLITFCEWLTDFMTRYPNTTLVIERRSTGAMIVDHLLISLRARDINPYTRLYNRVVQEADDYPDRFKTIQRPLYAIPTSLFTEHKKLFGFATSAYGATSRSDLYGTTLNSAVKYTADTVRDKKTIDQLLSLVIRNGRIDHEEGGHDDNCIAWLLSYWLLIHGKNLEYYGINSREILKHSTQRQEEISTGSYYDQYHEALLREKIDTLIETLRSEPDEYLARRDEAKLRHYLTQLESYRSDPIAIDDFLLKLKQERQLRLRLRSYR
jgi:hypothetical protein